MSEYQFETRDVGRITLTEGIVQALGGPVKLQAYLRSLDDGMERTPLMVREQSDWAPVSES